MNDLVFSELEDIASETFSQFAPYSMQHSVQQQLFDNEFSNFQCTSNAYAHNYSNAYNAYTPKSAPASFSQGIISAQVNPTEMALRRIHVQDQAGRDIDAMRISKVKLKLLSNFFGVEFYDSVRGRSISQFAPNNIISFIRQVDVTGIYIRFCSTLQARVYSDNFIYSEEGKHYNDSPFASCVHLLVECSSDAEVSQVFDYVTRTGYLMASLKVVYHSWMLCANFCTQQDVHTISLQIDPNRTVCVQSSAVVQESCTLAKPLEGEEENDILNSNNDKIVTTGYEDKETDKEPTAPRTTAPVPINPPPNAMSPSKREEAILRSRPINWGKEAKNKEKSVKSKSLPIVSPDMQLSLPQQQQQQSMPLCSLFDTSKTETVLPPVFYSISADVREFAGQLLSKGALLAFQLTVGLCGALAIAETAAAKLRAKSLLKKLSQHPNVQLTNVHNIAQYIMHGKVPTNVTPVTNTPIEQAHNSSPAPQKQDKKREEMLAMIDAVSPSSFQQPVEIPPVHTPSQGCIIS